MTAACDRHGRRHGEGREILDAVREQPHVPLVVVNTHAHYDALSGALFSPTTASHGSGLTTTVPWKSRKTARDSALLFEAVGGR
jgi:glyoxylase-like metal-dependent hydrolase (beta-lactamase superfamily II)